jgi:hypothetical protein
MENANCSGTRDRFTSKVPNAMFAEPCRRWRTRVGREAHCLCKWGNGEGKVKALLESQELILRGDHRRRIPISQMKRVGVESDCLCFDLDGERISLALGADEAERWAKKIAKPPPTLREKMGVGPAAKAFIVGRIAAPALRDALHGACTKTPAEAKLAIAVVAEEADLMQAMRTHAQLPDGAAIWIVYGKGRAAAFGESAVRSGMRAGGFIDTKVAAVSPELTAMRFSRQAP